MKRRGNINMVSKAHVIIGIFLLALLAGCDSSGPREKLLPPVGFVADAGKGETLFRANCARCHGPGAMGGRQGPPLINAIYRPGHHADLAFYWAVRDGVRQHHWQFGDMPAVAGLSAEDVGHIVAYVRREQRENGIR